MKAPVGGAVKTRLVPPLSSGQAVELSRCFIEDTVERVGRAATDAHAAVVAVYAPADAPYLFDDILPVGCPRLPQRGSDLGTRMKHAAEDLLAHGATAWCLVGTDIPTLPLEILADAVTRIRQTPNRIVIGPAADGGYYLIAGGASVPAALFEGITWSAPDVCAVTLQRADAARIQVDLLPEWYDVDDGASLERLRSECLSLRRNAGAGLPARTAGFLASFDGPPDLIDSLARPG